MANNFQQRDASLPLVRLLMEVVEKVGVTTTKTILTQAARQCSAAEEKRKTEILNAVCIEMRISVNYLLKYEPYCRDEAKKWSQTYAIVLIKNELKWKPVQIASVFGMTDRNVFNRMYEFQNLDKKSIVDIHRIQQFTKINKILNKK